MKTPNASQHILISRKQCFELALFTYFPRLCHEFGPHVQVKDKLSLLKHRKKEE
jgi:hypothetical protein